MHAADSCGVASASFAPGFYGSAAVTGFAGGFNTFGNNVVVVNRGLFRNRVVIAGGAGLGGVAIANGFRGSAVVVRGGFNRTVVRVRR